MDALEQMFRSKQVAINVKSLEINGEEAPIEKWSHSETIALLESYKLHQHMFNQTKGRQVVWESIHQHLANQGINKSYFHIANKWKNLLRTYRNVKHSNRQGKRIRFQYMDAMTHVLENDSVSDIVTQPENDTSISQHPFSETATVSNNQNITIEFSSEDNFDEIKNYIDYSVDDNSLTTMSKTVYDNNISAPKNTVVDLKTKYLKTKIAEITDRRNEREKYLNVVRDAKRLKRKREERKLELKEKELEIEERKVCALEQYLALKHEKL